MLNKHWRTTGGLEAADEIRELIFSVCTQLTTIMCSGLLFALQYIQYDKMNGSAFFHGDWFSRGGVACVRG